jgi:hypothetical protein
MKNKLFIISSVILITIALVFLYISSIPITFSDDLCFYFKYTKEGNVFSIAQKMYIEKEGRFASLPGLFQISGFRYLGFNGTALMWGLFFLSNIVLIALFNKEQSDKGSRVFQLLFLTVLLLFSFEHILNEIVFWPTGGVYSFSIFLSLLFLLALEYKISYWKIIIMALLIATTGPNLTIPIMFILFVNWLYEQVQLVKKSILVSSGKVFLLLIILLAGLLILTQSPGTIRRMNSISTFWMWHPRYIIEVVLKTIYTSFIFYPIAFPLFVAVLIKSILNFSRGLKENRLFYQIVSSLYEIRYLLGALISVLIFVRTPGVFTQRAAVFFMVLIIIQFYQSFYRLLSKNLIRNISLGLASIILILMSYTAVFYTKQYNTYHKDMKSTQVTNSEFADKHIYKDYHFFFKHYKADEKIPENIWLDQCLEKYRHEIFETSK